MRIGVIGAGAWGTALAQLAATEGEPVLLWAREPDVISAVNLAHENQLFLPGIALSPSIEATGDPGRMDSCDAILVAVPAQYVARVLARTPVGPRALVLCAKGIEASTGRLMTEVAATLHPSAPLAVLSGPTFAAEVAAGKPTAVTLATTDEQCGRALIQRLARPHFRPYASTDVIGAEIGGAVKNVIAIACGVVAGLKLGENARAALIARGFAEMTRFGVARGGRTETISGLSGLGDLVLTCSSTQSRNFTLGKALGEGKRAKELIGASTTVAEGAFTAPVLAREAHRLGIDMPVVEAVRTLIEDGREAREVVATLLARPLRGEAS
ncbi:MAG: NAD(P)H-dependent glycerol-3-phosphate dehydrogenase [Sphingomonas sp.]|jgi:glycerol-3-phosphate dehydrogenase (NAD(P)+)